MKEGTPERKGESPRDPSAIVPGAGGAGDRVVEDIEIAVVAGIFYAKADEAERLAYALSRYVVLSRMEPGCRNIDLVTSVTAPGLFMVWEKWESHDHRKAHFDADAATAMADAVRDLVREPPQFDIFDAISAHDLT